MFVVTRNSGGTLNKIKNYFKKKNLFALVFRWYHSAESHFASHILFELRLFQATFELTQTIHTAIKVIKFIFNRVLMCCVFTFLVSRNSHQQLLLDSIFGIFIIMSKSLNWISWSHILNANSYKWTENLQQNHLFLW